MNLETYFEIVGNILRHLEHNEEASVVKKVHEEKGRDGLYTLAENWTIEFEELYKDFIWGETVIEGKEDWSWYDFIDDFFITKNKIIFIKSLSN